MAPRKIIVGSRASKLARTQTNLIIDQLKKLNPEMQFEVRIVQTEGDRRFDQSLRSLGGKGAFTSAIDQALRDGVIDFAVHSFKDLPTGDHSLLSFVGDGVMKGVPGVADGVALAAVPLREDPADWLIAKGPLDITKGKHRIGTSSSRRAIQLRAMNSELEIVSLRGNVTTRLEKLGRGGYDGIILAAAGLRRLGVSPPWYRALEPYEMLSAPAQGALAIVARKGDGDVLGRLRPLHCRETFLSCALEREGLRIAGGGCDSPVGARCVVYENHFILHYRIHFSEKGTESWEVFRSGNINDAEKVIAELEQEYNEASASADQTEDPVLNNGIPEIEKVHDGPLTGKVVAVTRDEDSDGPLSLLLRAAGADPITLPVASLRPLLEDDALVKYLEQLKYGSWVVISSSRSIELMMNLHEFSAREFSRRAIRFAVVGCKSAELLKHYGVSPEIVSVEGGAEGLVDIFANTREMDGEYVFLPESSATLSTLKTGLQKQGAFVTSLVLYENIPDGQNASILCRMIEKCQIDILAFTSPSAVQVFRDAWGQFDLPGKPVVASIGTTTTREVVGFGWTVHLQPEIPSFENLVDEMIAFQTSENFSVSHLSDDGKRCGGLAEDSPEEEAVLLDDLESD